MLHVCQFQTCKHTLSIAAEVHVDKKSSLKINFGKYMCVCLSISRIRPEHNAHAEADYFWTCSFAYLSISGDVKRTF